jgi:CheY-like chemotaxis protein
MIASRDALKILVVDDDADWRDVVCEVLGSLGHEVVAAADGETALVHLAQERFDAVLLDLMMPGLSGEQVAARLPRDAPPVVFVTGLPAEDVGRALSGGAHYYLPKAAGVAEMQLMLDSLSV